MVTMDVDSRGGLRTRLDNCAERGIGRVEVVLQQQRIQVRPHHEVDRRRGFVQASCARTRRFAGPPAAPPAAVAARAPHRPAPIASCRWQPTRRCRTACGRGRTAARLASVKTLNMRRSFSVGRSASATAVRVGFDFVQAVRADHLADRLFRLEELVDIGLPKPMAFARSDTVVFS